MLPTRVCITKSGTFYGYGDTTDVREVSSIHERGHEPDTDTVFVFGKRWVLDRGHYVYGDKVYMTWTPSEVPN